MEVARAGAGEAAELDGLLRPMRDGGALMPSACVVQVKALVLFLTFFLPTDFVTTSLVAN